MRRLTKLKINESVEQQRLIFEEDLFDVYQRLAVYFLFGAMVSGALIAIAKTDFGNPNDLLLSVTLFPFIILLGLYVIYRQTAEKKLSKIITNLDREINKQILLDFAKTKNFSISKNSGNYLVMNEQLSDFNPDYKKSMIFIIRNNCIFFTILKDQFRLNMPTLFSHLWLKEQLIRMIKLH